jgi:hypothetical protein
MLLLLFCCYVSVCILFVVGCFDFVIVDMIYGIYYFIIYCIAYVVLFSVLLLFVVLIYIVDFVIFYVVSCLSFSSLPHRNWLYY